MASGSLSAGAVTENASSELGLAADPKQNQRLGEILEQLRG